MSNDMAATVASQENLTSRQHPGNSLRIDCAATSGIDSGNSSTSSPAISSSSSNGSLTRNPVPSPSSSSVPSPSTGMMSPSTSGSRSPDLVHDLPPDLLSAGWRRFWSRRESREYFYNKLTRESLWEMPSLTATEPTSDPLGITQVSPPVTAVSGPPGLTPGPVKRSSSEDISQVIASKRLVLTYSPFWNFNIVSNVMVLEKAPLNFLPPHPDVEQTRSQSVAKLRQSYEELCMTREGISAPSDSFNRWLLERKVSDRGTEPMLPSACDPALTTPVSPSMCREIMNDIPVRLFKPRVAADARTLLFRYAEAAKQTIEKRGKSSESRKVVKWNAEDTMEWMRKYSHAKFEDYVNRLAHLKRQCQPHLMEAAKSEVEAICAKVYTLSCEHARKLQERHSQIFLQHNIDPTFRPPNATDILRGQRVPSHPAFLSVPSPARLPAVDHSEQNEVVTLKYKGETLQLNSLYFRKLEQLYQLNCRDDPRMENFLTRAWCMLRRYETLFGSGVADSMQGAIPVPVFECLHKVFGVTFECFASPLNCYFRQYCSAYPDTDCYFGSHGSILDVQISSGSFEANPPFSEELMEAMVDHFESCLSESNEPLSFIVFIPDWRDPPTEALVRLESSRFKRKQITIPAMEHVYRNGMQHVCPRSELNVKSIHGTLAVFLQNDAGFNRWGPTEERMSELATAYQLPPELKK